MNKVLELEEVSRTFSSGVFRTHTVRAVDRVSFALERGKTFGLVGNSGCGKTTLSRMITRVLKPSGGRIRFEGEDIARLDRKGSRAYHRRVQIIFQNPEASLDPSMRIRDSLLEAMAIHRLGESREERMEKIRAALGQVGLPDYLLSRYPHQISGGEGQRLVICRALLLEPEVLLLDEPTSMLDVSVQASIMNLLRDYLKEYGTFQQKKEAIALEYDEKIAASQNEWEKKSFEKQKTEALSAIDMEQFKQGINWELIFGDLSKVSKKSLEDVKLQLKSFKDSPEYKNMNVEQKKVIDEALNNIQTTIIDKGGLLGDLPEQLDALRMAQDELTKAQNEYNEAMENGTDEQKEAALKKKNAAQQGVTNAETNVTKAKDKTVSNLIILSDAITQLGSSSEMSLSQIGGLAENITNIFTEAGSKIGGIIGAAFSLLDVINKQGLDGFVENVFSSVFNAARGIWDTITFGAFSKITGSGDSDVNLEKDLEYLAQSNQDLKNALDNLSDKMDKASLTDASDIYNVQKDNIEKQMANTQESMQRSGAAYSNGFIGIGGAHSSNNKIDNGMSASDWSKISSIVGHSVKNASDFFKLSSKEMAKLAEEDTTLYSKIKGLADDGYKDAAQYMDEYITYYKQLEELENAYNEKLTNTSFDSVRDNFKSALLDMESDAEDFANSFEKMMQNAVIESLMTSKYDKLIQDWYTDFAKAMEDGKIDEYEQDFLQKKWNNIVDQGLAERNALKEAMGWESSFSSSQSSTSGGFQTMSQDTGDELNGRFTALQMAGEEIKIQSEFQSQSLNLLTAKADAILSVNTEVRNIADETRTLIANSYLELVQISENTGNTVKYLKDIQTDMAEVKNNTKGLVR